MHARKPQALREAKTDLIGLVSQRIDAATRVQRVQRIESPLYLGAPLDRDPRRLPRGETDDNFVQLTLPIRGADVNGNCGL